MSLAHSRSGSRSRARRKGELSSELNVTPLVDVVLVLLIIFMVVTPYLQQGVPIELPSADHAADGNPSEGPLVVTLRSDGTLWLGQQRMGRDTLLTKLRAELASRPDRHLMVRGDRHVHYGKVEELLGWLRSAGAPGAELATLADRG